MKGGNATALEEQCRTDELHLERSVAPPATAGQGIPPHGARGIRSGPHGDGEDDEAREDEREVDEAEDSMDERDAVGVIAAAGSSADSGADEDSAWEPSRAKGAD